MYGITISLAITVAILFASKLISKDKENTLWHAAFWTVLFGVIGARLYHVLHYLNFYTQDPALIVQIWNGGLGIFGGLIFGTLALVTVLTIQKEPILKWLDLAAVVTPLAQAIGRFGNYFNHELYGLNSQPVFFYESALDFILFFILLALFKKAQSLKVKQKLNLKQGSIFFAYLFGYALIRLLLEPLKVNQWQILWMSTASLVSFVFIAISVLWLVRTYCLKQHAKKG